jgi:hypothetical protein
MTVTFGNFTLHGVTRDKARWYRWWYGMQGYRVRVVR